MEVCIKLYTVKEMSIIFKISTRTIITKLKKMNIVKNSQHGKTIFLTQKQFDEFIERINE